MAELILSTIGEAAGTRMAPAAFRSFAGAVGRTAGAYVGRSIDQRLFGETRRYEGARFTDLHVQGSTEGASMPVVFGRVRLAGQVIWAARFKEHEETSEVGGGKGGPPAAKRTDFRYTLSFAVGLCEGEVARIGRAWANGEPFDLSQCAWRLHRGTEDQAPDALIEAIEGADNAPAYRGLSYIVFEDLPLENFGNGIPQLSFEVIRAAPAEGTRLEQKVRGVCMIPGAGEFVYATSPVRRVIGPGQETTENVHVEHERANFEVALDQLEADLPNCESVLLVVAWFGSDLRCGHCEIRPGVEIAEKETAPLQWRVNGLNRDEAHLISSHDGGPAYGGTPADASVIEAITALKARGYKVGLYPFLLMDVPAGNALPDPYGGAAQAAYPWRGRITLSAPSVDKTSGAASEIANFFGDAAPGDFNIEDGAPFYDGPEEWSYRRFVLHHAKLAQTAGGVDAFIIGSELRGVTRVRSNATTFPAVTALRTLAADVRGMLGAAKLTYAADWSEYFGHQPDDGSGDVLFHLDPLWADSNIDCIGIDWYPPLTDWRDGRTHLDAQHHPSIHDPAYLSGRIEAGENYDWYYASDADRATQTRTPISDGAYSEPWIYRAKDVRNFWAHAHYDRPGGVRASTPTAWIPQSKPIWFTELGCPTIDKGANAPNLFVDPKSAESAAPPYSSGARDDLIQRRTLEAYLNYWDGEANPISDVYDAPMLDADGVFVWCWDARPHPAFPARADVWADGEAWRLGHWLNGRAGMATLGDCVAEICARAGVDDANVSNLFGAVSGYVIDAPFLPRGVLEPLMAAYAFNAAEREGGIVFFHADETPPLELALGDCAAESADDAFATRADVADAPLETRIRFLDPQRDYLLASASARRLDALDGGVETIEAPLVLESEAAEQIAVRVLAERRAASELARIALGPAHLALEPGDRVTLNDVAYEILRIEDAETRRADLRRAADVNPGALRLAEPAAPPAPAIAGRPVFALLDLPPLPGSESEDRPLCAAFASPWFGAHLIYAGASDDALSQRARVTIPAIMGELLWDLWPGPTDRWDRGNVVRVRLYGGSLSSVTADAVLNGANAFAIEAADGAWEIVQARSCVLVAPGEYELSDFLRGQQGTEQAMRSPHPSGARIVKLDARLARVDVSAHEWGDDLRFAAPPFGATSADARAARLDATPVHAALRPWAPAHLRAARVSGGDVRITWVRRARIGDHWSAGEPPIGAAAERYRVEIVSSGVVVRSAETTAPEYVYSAANQTADFGAPPPSVHIRAAQLDDAGAPGLKADRTMPL